MLDDLIAVVVGLVVIVGGGIGLLWMARRPQTWNATPAPAADPGVPVLTRTYRGNPAEAGALFTADAEALAEFGYVPVSQAYLAGAWGCGAFVLAALLILVVGLGLLVIAYLLIVKPPGTLTVTYQRRAPESPARQVFAVQTETPPPG